MLVAPKSRSGGNLRYAQPYCRCWSTKCSCGEENDVTEWGWETPSSGSSWVVINENKRQVLFHPLYSSGTAAVKGDMPMVHNYHYYWEVKIVSDPYGTDTMVGIGTDKVDLTESQFKFTSLLGQDEQSYGLSYTGSVRHDSILTKESVGFCRGSIVGVRVDMWRGTLEFYINRKPQGIAFYNLRRHQELYPIICSTAAQSSMRLIYAASWRASLLVDAAKILASSLNKDQRDDLPPGLWYTFRSQFWLTLPTADDSDDQDDNNENNESEDRPRKMTKSMLNAEPDAYPHFYMDNTHVSRDYPIVVYQ